MKKLNSFKDDDGFVLVVALMLLLVTTLMGTMLLINAANQSKLTRANEGSAQTFLGSETATQNAMRWLQDEATAARYPFDVPGQNYNAICNFPLGVTYDFAFRTPAPVNLATEMGLAGDLAIPFTNKTYEWVLSESGATAASGENSGSEVGMQSGYSSSGTQTALQYRIISCAIDNENIGGQIETKSRVVIETIVSISS